VKGISAYRLTLGLILALLVPAGLLQAQSTATGFTPFGEFIARVGAQTIAPPGALVKDAASFTEMRQYVLTMYQGVQVGHSFVQDSSTFDCIRIHQQPSVRLLGLGTIATPPPLSALAAHSSPPPDSAAIGPVSSASQIDPTKPTDTFGNAIGCGANTIPMRRITLEEMTGFPTVNQFLQKGPDGAGQPSVPGRASASVAAAGPAPSHKYAVGLERRSRRLKSAGRTIQLNTVAKDPGYSSIGRRMVTTEQAAITWTVRLLSKSQTSRSSGHPSPTTAPPAVRSGNSAPNITCSMATGG